MTNERFLVRDGGWLAADFSPTNSLIVHYKQYEIASADLTTSPKG